MEEYIHRILPIELENCDNDPQRIRWWRHVEDTDISHCLSSVLVLHHFNLALHFIVVSECELDIDVRMHKDLDLRLFRELLEFFIAVRRSPSKCTIQVHEELLQVRRHSRGLARIGLRYVKRTTVQLEAGDNVLQYSTQQDINF